MLAFDCGVCSVVLAIPDFVIILYDFSCFPMKPGLGPKKQCLLFTALGNSTSSGIGGSSSSPMDLSKTESWNNPSRSELIHS
jgi:hypothetical protein